MSWDKYATSAHQAAAQQAKANFAAIQRTLSKVRFALFFGVEIFFRNLANLYQSTLLTLNVFL